MIAKAAPSILAGAFGGGFASESYTAFHARLRV
jgi:hypothetical protein